MIRMTDAPPWRVVPADDKKSGRTNCISHLRGAMLCEQVRLEKPGSGRRDQRPRGDVPDASLQHMVPDVLRK